MATANNWKQLNKLPVRIRRKTTEYNVLLFEKLIAEEKAKNINHSKEDIDKLLEEDSSLIRQIKGPHFFSSLNGWMLQDAHGARKMYINVLSHATLEYANQFITVWIRDDWRMLKDVYKEL